MTKILPFLLAALAGLSSCADSNNPPPAAPLQATWQGVSTRDVETSPTGAVVSDNTLTHAPGSTVVEFTATEVIVYSGSAVFRRFDYTRTGNTLLLTMGGVGGPPEHITELTTSRLVLTSTAERGTNTRTRTSTYSR